MTSSHQDAYSSWLFHFSSCSETPGFFGCQFCATISTDRGPTSLSVIYHGRDRPQGQEAGPVLDCSNFWHFFAQGSFAERKPSGSCQIGGSFISYFVYLDLPAAKAVVMDSIFPLIISQIIYQETVISCSFLENCSSFGHLILLTFCNLIYSIYILFKNNNKII